MEILRFTWALIRIPRLFISLFLFPILLSIAVVYGQLLVTGLYLRLSKQSATEIQQNIESSRHNNPLRWIIYGSGEARPPIKICRWQASGDTEVPPNDPECAPQALDVAVNVPDPANYDPKRYVLLFNENFERLHICRECAPYLRIRVLPDKNISDVKSIWSLALLSISKQGSESQQRLLARWEALEVHAGLIGNLRFMAAGFTKPLDITHSPRSISLVMTIASLVAIALWLSLKAHRRILEYFVRSGALLPMVAACGKRTFYGSLWVLTLLRVLVFLSAAIPISLFTLLEMNENEPLPFIQDSPLMAALWIIALCTGLSVATVIGSIADLKQRHAILGFAYRYLPLLAAVLGSTLWCLTFLAPMELLGTVRSIITALPVVGIMPLLTVPLLTPPLWVVATHAISACVFTVFLLRKNSAWFAAHLEEL